MSAGERTDGRRVSVRGDVGFWEILAFACEGAMLIALGYAGWVLGAAPAGIAGGIALAAALPVLAGLAWGAWLAPAARRRLSGAPLVVAKTAVFVTACLLLGVAGQPFLALLLAVVSVLDTAVVSRRPASAAG